MLTHPGSRRRPVSAPSRLRLRDLGSEALAGLLQRPARAALTVVGTILGIGGFVAIVGLAQTAAGQIGKDFNLQDATQVTINDSGAAKAACPRWTSRRTPTPGSTGSTG